jgi:hypothetical protein
LLTDYECEFEIVSGNRPVAACAVQKAHSKESFEKITKLTGAPAVAKKGLADIDGALPITGLFEGGDLIEEQLGTMKHQEILAASCR